MRKKFIIIFIFFAIMLLAILSSGPFLTLYSIKQSVGEKDSIKLSNNINFPILRFNIKDQLSKELSKKVKLESDIFNILAEGFASKLVDETVDILLTPGNLLRLINGEEPSSILRNEKVSFNENNSYEILERINYKFESHKKFSVFVRGKNKKVIQLMLRRSGFQWQLSNITIPDIN